MCLVESTDAIGDARRIALRDPNVEGNPVLAVMDVEAIEEVSDEQMATMTEMVYRTTTRNTRAWPRSTRRAASLSPGRSRC
jgi:sulfate adenylyltransferase